MVNLDKSNNLLQIVVCLLMILLAIFISACVITNPPDAPNFYVGTKGLEMKFLDQAPPSDIYEGSSFSAGIMVENGGAVNVMDDSHGILSLSFDPFYIELIEITNTTSISVTKNGFNFKGIQLPGKSIYYPTGYETFYTFPNFKTKSIMGQREQPDTQLFASLCYPYQTSFSGLVCVDFNLFGENLRKQVCAQKDLSLSGGQGAPVAIVGIATENQPVGNRVRPVFTLHIQNLGSGTVLTNYLNAPNLDRTCAFQELNREDFNTIGVRAALSGTKELQCTPQPVRLFNGEGFVRCMVKDEDLILGNQNYPALLSINLSYVYLTSASKTIKVKRLNPYGGSTTTTGSACQPYEIEAPVDGVTRCIAKCDYCARYDPSDGRCAVPRDSSHPDLRITLQAGFACQCSYQECIGLYPDGLCVPTSNFCPGSSYCCMPACTSSAPVRINGKCYPKCSSSSSASKCIATTRDCACGTGTDPASFKLAASGRICCPLLAENYADAASCTSACTTTATNG